MSEPAKADGMTSLPSVWSMWRLEMAWRWKENKWLHVQPLDSQKRNFCLCTGVGHSNFNSEQASNWRRNRAEEPSWRCDGVTSVCRASHETQVSSLKIHTRSNGLSNHSILIVFISCENKQIKTIPKQKEILLRNFGRICRTRECWVLRFESRRSAKWTFVRKCSGVPRVLSRNLESTGCFRNKSVPLTHTAEALNILYLIYKHASRIT